jgi:mannosyltransferase
MAFARLPQRLTFLIVFVGLGLISLVFITWSTDGTNDELAIIDSGFVPLDTIDLSGGKTSGNLHNNPLLDDASEPQGELSRFEEIYPQVPATLMSLVRNSEAKDIMESVIQVEAAFNYKFNYPWTFFNDEPFTEHFKQEARRATGANCSFVTIDSEDWLEPKWIDKEKAKKDNEELASKHRVQYAEMPSYHRMCRWNSGTFYNNPALAQYKYYWRVEPKTSYFCDIDYDVFAYMQNNNKDYGFVINIYDSPDSMVSLWPTVQEFFKKNPKYIHPNNALQWLTHNERPDIKRLANGYSTCHFWSNFEIGSLDFFRSKKYQDYFEYLDKAGGFFYERWGDAPVHSIALAMMTDKSRIHWFKDIGYMHFPYFNCPASAKCRGCEPGKFTAIDGLEAENCMSQWFKAAGAH